MLTQITIRNFAIVDELALELQGGLSVLSGETGAGKSILLDALSLALGDRADNSVIRHGENRAEISVGFDVGSIPAARDWLIERELEAGEECIIRRTLNRDGASKAYINGQPSPIQSLRELGEMLVDLHGQHEHQSLLRKGVQRELLDDFAEHGELLAALGTAYADWKALSDEFEHLRQQGAERDSRLELLRFQAGEMEALSPQEGEWDELEHEHSRLANAQHILRSAETALNLLYESDESSVSGLLGKTAGDLRELANLDGALGNIADLLDSAEIQVREAASDLRHYLDGFELDPDRLEWVEQRVSALHGAARKYRLEPAALPGLLPELRQELEALEGSELRLGRLEADIGAAAASYRKLAARLSKGRAKAAAALSAAVTERMQELGMPGGVFEVRLTSAGDTDFAPTGLERVEFMVTANPGQPAKPLQKVASGGELSRISLAIQVVTAQNARIPTLVFDEVDVGVGGGIAEIVGRQLRALGATRQVLCVTHLPQVAALGHHHFRVAKSTSAETTVTSIEPLSAKGRTDEIARMLGGLKITDQTLSHAREMIERAQVVN